MPTKDLTCQGKLRANLLVRIKDSSLGEHKYNYLEKEHTRHKGEEKGGEIYCRIISHGKSLVKTDLTSRKLELVP